MKRTTNLIKIPKTICHKHGWHKWVSPTRSRAMIAIICKRCGMNQAEEYELNSKENPNSYL